MSIFVVVRALHILVAALWVGAGVFFTLFLMPTVRQLGPGGAPVMAGIMRRRMGGFMGAISGLTILTGLWLYWEFTHGLDAGISFSAPGVVLALGGIAGIIAAVIGGAVIGRSMERVVALEARTDELIDENERTAHLQALVRLRQRAYLAARCDAVLLVTALLLMAVGHYV